MQRVSILGHSSSFRYLAIITNASMNFCIYISVLLEVCLQGRFLKGELLSQKANAQFCEMFSLPISNVQVHPIPYSFAKRMYHKAFKFASLVNEKYFQCYFNLHFYYKRIWISFHILFVNYSFVSLAQFYRIFIHFALISKRLLLIRGKDRC